MNTEIITALPPAQERQNPLALRIFGHLISFVFHPLFIPSYIAAYIIYVDPYAFAALNDRGKMFKFIAVLFSTAFLPLFSVVLMKQLGFIKSIMLRDQKDRIIPYIVSMIFYFWAWYVSRNLHDTPFMVAMLLAVFLLSIAGMMANIYFKISMHGMAAGAVFVLFTWMAYNGMSGIVLAPVVLVTGLICTARFIVSDHNAFEVYSGLMAGALCQLIAIGIAG